MTESTQPQESIPDVLVQSPTTSIPLGPAQTALSSPGQASLVPEHPSEPSAPTTVRVPDAVLISPPRPTSSSSNQAILASKPVPDIPREHIAEVVVPPEARQRVPSLTIQAPTPVSTHGTNRAPENTPPQQDVRVTRSYPTLDETAHARGHRSISRFVDSETAWYANDERETTRERNVAQRLAPTMDVVAEELSKATERARRTGWAQNVATTLQILIGALTTALGAALGGTGTTIAISTLGVASTLVASFLARTRSSNEPHKSRSRARELKRLLREMESFSLDHGYEVGDKWDEQINEFRLRLETIFGHRPRSKTETDAGYDAESDTGEEKGERSDDRAANSSRNRRRSVSTKKVKSKSVDVV